MDSLLGKELATTLDYQIRSQGVKYTKFGIEVKTYAYGISASKSTAQETYNAMIKIFPIRSDYSIGFVGYQALNFAAEQDHEGIAQYFYQQKWLTTNTSKDQINGRVF